MKNNCENRDIKILNDKLINKISAGEVVERPGSVVKELVENSIDADAKFISIEIKSGGINFIRVIDNGNGIKSSMIENAFKNHATSKIYSLEEFENVMSLGFRGEALCSIAAIAQVEIITKTNREILGTKMKINGGEIISCEKIACNTGTDILVKNIFYNTPARLKFLKKPAFESSYINNIITRFILSNPEIKFKFINNNKIIFSSNGDKNLKLIIERMFGNDVLNNLLEVNYKENNLKLIGFLMSPELARNTRTQQNFFVNKRYIKNKIIVSAIENAYKNKIITGKFPGYVLNFYIEPNLIDVNVHPSKTEIRFADENFVYEFIFKAVSKILDKKAKQKINAIRIKNSQEKNNSIENKFENNKKNTCIENELEDNKKNNSIENKFEDNKKNNCIENKFEDNEKNSCIENKLKDNKKNNCIENKLEDNEKNNKSKNIFEQVEFDFNNKSNYKIVGKIFETYWIIETKEKIFMLDQHAAHERIIYERIKKNFKNFSQRLIEPIYLKFNFDDAQIFRDNILNTLNKFGFEINITNEKELCVKSLPNGFEITQNFFYDLLDFFKENIYKKDVTKFFIEDIISEKLAKISCASAVKAGDNLSEIEAKEIIKIVFENLIVFNCPHGRPIIIDINKNQIEKLFCRIT
jgi:DNA mismatch repair protein MutL